MTQQQMNKKDLAWLLTHNKAFAEAYMIRKRIDKEREDNRRKMAKAMKQAEKH